MAGNRGIAPGAGSGADSGQPDPDRGRRSGHGGHSGRPMSGLPELRGKVAVVTGGASGIGKGIATQLVAEGMRVIIADIERDALDETAGGDRRDRRTGRRQRRRPASRRSPAPSSRPVRHRARGLQQRRHRADGGDQRPDHGRLALDARREPVRGHPRRAHVPADPARQPRRRAHREHRLDGRPGRADRGSARTRRQVRGGGAHRGARRRTRRGELEGRRVRALPGDGRTPTSALSSRNRPADLPDAGLLRTSTSSSRTTRGYRWIGPDEAGAVVVRAIKRGDLYALTHPDWYPQVRARHEAIAAAFREQEARGSRPRREADSMRATIAYYDPPRRPARGERPDFTALPLSRQAGDRRRTCARPTGGVLPRPGGLHAGRPRRPRCGTSTTGRRCRAGTSARPRAGPLASPAARRPRC